MIQAAARGIIDFKNEVRFDDRSWFRKLAWILDDIERQNAIEVLKLRNESYCAILIRNQNSESLGGFLDLLDDVKGEVFDNYFPYLAGIKVDNESRRPESSQAKTMSDSWRKLFGDPDDPAVKEKIARTIAQIENPKKQSRWK